MSKTRKKILILGMIIAAVSLAAWIVWDNGRIVVTTIEVESEHLPENFDGYCIAHVSDLHNDEFGEDNVELLALIKEAKPDMIAITGDLLDSRRTNVEKALNFAEKAAQIAPCYYVTGNHESRVEEEYEQLENAMIEAGVVVLRNDTVTLENGGQQLVIAGMDDPKFYISSDKLIKTKHTAGKVLTEVLGDVPAEEFTLLLSHRPEIFEVYCEQDVDLVLSGHVHGGQFRLPIVGGLVGPSEGIFPKYDAGLFCEKNTNMIVSRGLGQSVIPFRVNNPPELVLVTLKSEAITE